MVDFEQKIRTSAEKNPSAYYLCNFACCREILTDKKRLLTQHDPSKAGVPIFQENQKQQKDQEESKEDGRGKIEEETKMQEIVNFCFIYGSKQKSGIKANSKFVSDIINLYRDNADITGNYVDVPVVYNQVKRTDCNFEVAASNLAQQLRLQRTNDVVGPKVLFYAYDSEKNKEMADTRKLFTEFMKKNLGFSDEQIIMIDQKELVAYEDE